MIVRIPVLHLMLGDPCGHQDHSQTLRSPSPIDKKNCPRLCIYLIMLAVSYKQEKYVANLTTILLRGLLLRCPNCGKGKLFRRGFSMYERCSVCGWRFEREEGYWTGAVALNLVVTELLIALVAVPLAISLALAHQPITLLIIIGLPMPFVLPFLFFRHAKSFWMSIDFMIHPLDREERK